MYSIELALSGHLYLLQENVQRSTESVMVEDFANADSSSTTSEDDAQQYALNYKKWHSITTKD